MNLLVYRSNEAGQNSNLISLYWIDTDEAGLQSQADFKETVIKQPAVQVSFNYFSSLILISLDATCYSVNRINSRMLFLFPVFCFQLHFNVGKTDACTQCCKEQRNNLKDWREFYPISGPFNCLGKSLPSAASLYPAQVSLHGTSSHTRASRFEVSRN